MNGLSHVMLNVQAKSVQGALYNEVTSMKWRAEQLILAAKEAQEFLDRVQQDQPASTSFFATALATCQEGVIAATKADLLRQQLKTIEWCMVEYESNEE